MSTTSGETVGRTLGGSAVVSLNGLWSAAQQHPFTPLVEDDYETCAECGSAPGNRRHLDPDAAVPRAVLILDRSICAEILRLPMPLPGRPYYQVPKMLRGQLAALQVSA